MFLHDMKLSAELNWKHIFSLIYIWPEERDIVPNEVDLQACLKIARYEFPPIIEERIKLASVSTFDGQDCWSAVKAERDWLHTWLINQGLEDATRAYAARRLTYGLSFYFRRWDLNGAIELASKVRTKKQPPV